MCICYIYVMYNLYMLYMTLGTEKIPGELTVGK